MVNLAQLTPANSAVDGAIGVLLRNGITSVHHMGVWENVAPLKRARDSGRLKVRVKASLPLASWSEVASMVTKEGAGDSWLRFSGVKGMSCIYELHNTNSPPQATLMVHLARSLHSCSAPMARRHPRDCRPRALKTCTPGSREPTLRACSPASTQSVTRATLLFLVRYDTSLCSAT